MAFPLINEDDYTVLDAERLTSIRQHISQATTLALLLGPKGFDSQEAHEVGQALNMLTHVLERHRIEPIEDRS